MNRTPSERLSLIAKHYLDDQPALNQARQIADRRRASIPGIQAILQPFVAGAITLDEMRQQLDLYLRRPENDAWGTTGFWMMTLNQLANHHGDQGAAHLRQTLDGLDHTNVAERFEAFERFLRDEKQRLGLGLKLAAPGRSPFFIALFARWLDPGHDVLVPWPSLRRGLKALNDVAALPHRPACASAATRPRLRMSLILRRRKKRSPRSKRRCRRWRRAASMETSAFWPGSTSIASRFAHGWKE